jgi:hypothetical protein
MKRQMIELALVVRIGGTPVIVGAVIDDAMLNAAIRRVIAAAARQAALDGTLDIDLSPTRLM